MAKSSLLKGRNGTIKPRVGVIKGFYAFPKCICAKMNVIAQLVFEFAYYIVVFVHDIHVHLGTPHPKFLIVLGWVDFIAHQPL